MSREAKVGVCPELLGSAYIHSNLPTERAAQAQHGEHLGNVNCSMFLTGVLGAIRPLVSSLNSNLCCTHNPNGRWFKSPRNQPLQVVTRGTSLFLPNGVHQLQQYNADHQLGTRATSSSSEGTGTLSRFAGVYLNCRTADNNSS